MKTIHVTLRAISCILLVFLFSTTGLNGRMALPFKEISKEKLIDETSYQILLCNRGINSIFLSGQKYWLSGDSRKVSFEESSIISFLPETGTKIKLVQYYFDTAKSRTSKFNGPLGLSLFSVIKWINPS